MMSEVRFWDIETGERVADYHGDEDYGFGYGALSRDGRHVAVGDFSRLRILDAATGQTERTIDLPGSWGGGRRSRPTGRSSPCRSTTHRALRGIDRAAAAPRREHARRLCRLGGVVAVGRSDRHRARRRFRAGLGRRDRQADLAQAPGTRHQPERLERPPGLRELFARRQARRRGRPPGRSGEVRRTGSLRSTRPPVAGRCARSLKKRSAGRRWRPTGGWSSSPPRTARPAIRISSVSRSAPAGPRWANPPEDQRAGFLSAGSHAVREEFALVRGGTERRQRGPLQWTDRPRTAPVPGRMADPGAAEGRSGPASPPCGTPRSAPTDKPWSRPRGNGSTFGIPTSGTLRRKFRHPHQHGCNVMLAPDGRTLATSDVRNAGDPGDDTIRLFDIETGEQVLTLDPGDGRASVMAFSPDGTRLFTGFGRGSGIVWNMLRGAKGHRHQRNEQARRSSRLCANRYCERSGDTAIIMIIHAVTILRVLWPARPHYQWGIATCQSSLIIVFPVRSATSFSRRLAWSLVVVASIGLSRNVLARDGERATPPDRSILPRRSVRFLHAPASKCHGPEKQRGGLRLDSRASVLKGGDSGEPAIVPCDPDASALLERIASDDSTVRMPPKGERLSGGRTGFARALGGRRARPGPRQRECPARPRRDDCHGRRPRPLGVPAVAAGAAARSPFERPGPHARGPVSPRRTGGPGLTTAPRGRPATLIRRLTFDLTGLPPTPEEIAAFVHDDGPAAYERLVDRLLASPRYGERWGRHWLDLARYADSDGYEGDRDRKTAYRYRDFVIRALNADMPFDQFVRWQLAGDEYAPDNASAVAATGFCTAAPQPGDDPGRHRGKQGEDPLRRAGQHAGDDRLGPARPERWLRPLPRPQVRPDPHPRLLPHAGGVSDLRAPRGPALAAPPRPRSLADSPAPALSRSQDDRARPDRQPRSSGCGSRSTSSCRFKSSSTRSTASGSTRAQGSFAPGWRGRPGEARKARGRGGKAAARGRPKATGLVLLDRGHGQNRHSSLAAGACQTSRSRHARLPAGADTRTTPEDYLAKARLVAACHATGRTSRDSPLGTTYQRKALAEWITDIDHGAGGLLAV